MVDAQHHKTTLAGCMSIDRYIYMCRHVDMHVYTCKNCVYIYTQSGGQNHFSVEYAIRHTGVLLQWLWEFLHLWNSKNTESGIGPPLLVVKVLHTRGKAKERQTQLVMKYVCGSVIWTKNKQHNCDIVDYIIQQGGKTINDMHVCKWMNHALTFSQFCLTQTH